VGKYFLHVDENIAVVFVPLTVDSLLVQLESCSGQGMPLSLECYFYLCFIHPLHSEQCVMYEVTFGQVCYV
jgi:hypothetical protein